MSWFFKSLQITDDSRPSSPSSGDQSPSSVDIPIVDGSGVKDDLSVLGQTIGRQLRGVAAFLAPPPFSVTEEEEERLRQRTPEDSSAQQALEGIRNDLAEIGGNFKSGLTRLSNLLQFPTNLEESETEETDNGSEENEFDEVAGISEEVVEFAKEISSRPGCWTDFPLSLDSDFEMTDAQKEHASAIEHLVPALTVVREEVRRGVGDDHFWLIYFLLLMPRVNGIDLELLATPKVVKTRDELLLKLQQKREKDEEPCEETKGRSCSEEEEMSFSDIEADDGSDKAWGNGNIQNRRASNASGASDWTRVSQSEQQSVHSKESEGESSDWLAVGDSD